jgi:hypothetical protein
MKQENFIKIITAAIIVIFIIVIFTLLKLNQLEKEITKNILSSIPSLNQPPNNLPTKEEKNQEKITTINTNITFKTLSSVTLKPQSELNVLVEQISQTENGIINLKVKVFTDKATTDSALNLNNYFALVDIQNGEFQLPTEIKGLFDSMPPKSTTTGEVIFENFIKKNKIIIQIGPTDESKFYEFDFDNKSYKEIQIG